MYDDLIKKLREASKMSEALAVLLPNSDGNVTAKLYNNAADVIEKLEKEVQNWKITAGEEASGLEHWFENYQKDVPHWIPVTERLPKDKERVLIFYWLSTKPKIPWYKVATFSTKLSDVDKYDLYGKDHSGFYGSDSEYGYYEYTDIEYWMPLPEPPKEE